jgi:fructose transport system ATP-binding protein
MEGKGMRRSAAASPTKVVLLDEPTAALGLRESAKVRTFIEHLRGRGLPVVVVSHNIPQVLEMADRIHVQRLGKRVAVVTPQSFRLPEIIAIMGGALSVDEKEQTLGSVRRG